MAMAEERMSRVLAIIREHPGCKPAEIVIYLEGQLNQQQVGITLSRLLTVGRVERRPDHRYYPSQY